MTNTLEEQITRRVEQAVEKKIEEKSLFILNILGSKYYDDCITSGIYSEDIKWVKKAEYDIRDGNIEIKLNRPELKIRAYVERSFKDTVFHVDGRAIIGYIPGEWEEELDLVYEKAQRKAEEDIAEEVKRSWGIDLGGRR